MYIYFLFTTVYGIRAKFDNYALIWLLYYTFDFENLKFCNKYPNIKIFYIIFFCTYLQWHRMLEYSFAILILSAKRFFN